MTTSRLGGVLCHPTSFYSPHGIGDIGAAAHNFVDFLSASGCNLWQVLPLNPTGYGDSPYQTFSAFAGNPYLIDLYELVQHGWLAEDDFQEKPDFQLGRVDYGKVIPWKLRLLEKAFVQASSVSKVIEEIEDFSNRMKSWLDDYAIFMVLKEIHGGKPWTTWEPEYRDYSALNRQEINIQFGNEIRRQKFYQYLFYLQWNRLRIHAKEKKIQIIGDVPIYVAHDSADVWARPNLFELDPLGNPTVLAGVPPDYFSPLGQLWGNPIYRWEQHAVEEFSWWKSRMGYTLSTVDVVRMDHFRGFAGYWEIPGDAKDAVIGRWAPGPGAALFNAFQDEFGALPIIAEDLGEITPDVIELRDKYNLPGMKIFQFGFSGQSDHEFLPHTYPSNCVGYTGSHDNETLLGWYRNAPTETQKIARDYLGIQPDGNFCWAMIECLWNSPAAMVIAQMQDLLEIGEEGRMNIPSVPGGNWQWQMQPGDLNCDLAAQMKAISEKSGRG